MMTMNIDVGFHAHHLQWILNYHSICEDCLFDYIITLIENFILVTCFYATKSVVCNYFGN